MNWKTFVVLTVGLAVVGVYLFVTAPEPLPEPVPASAARISVQKAFEMLEGENDVARGLYAQEIVGKGQVAGLSFNEHWREPGTEAGPLPALFLRETSNHLAKSPLQLRLFLGASAPINKANAFKRRQLDEFQTLSVNREPRFFVDGEAGTSFAMFPDIASVGPCVECHNKHPDSPKTDWKLGDVMGATTWSFPRQTVTLEEMRDLVATLRMGFRTAYEAYLSKAATFAHRPVVGAQWPRDGYFLPSADAFMAELEHRSSAATMQVLLTTGSQADAGTHD